MNRRVVLNLTMSGLVGPLIAGCAAPSGWTESSDVGPARAQYAADGNVELVDANGAASEAVELAGVLTLEQALAAVLLRNPELAAFSFDVRAAEARVLQARVMPNPELELEVEEYDRAGEGFDSAETAVVLSQVFELGGKRQWRTRIAQAEGELAEWDYASKRLAILTQTAQRYTAVLAAQERLELSHAAVALAERTGNAVAEKVKAGKEPPFQASKSLAELEMARLDAREAEAAFDVARKRLAALWGAEFAEFEGVHGKLDRAVRPVPSLDELRPYLVQNPELARWESELRVRRAALSSEKAARIPDLEGSVGYLQYEEDGTDAFAFGIGMPLPLFDRNQGNIAAAAQGLAKVEAERTATEIALAAELAEARAALMVAHQRVVALRDKVVPAMEQTFRAAHEGYQQGKFGFLEMLDAQRGLFEATSALVSALSNYHTAWIDIRRLTGTHVEAMLNDNQED